MEVMNHNRDVNNAALEESDYSNVQSVDELTKSEEHTTALFTIKCKLDSHLPVLSGSD